MTTHKQNEKTVRLPETSEPGIKRIEQEYRKRLRDLLAIFDIAKQLKTLDVPRLVNFFLVTVSGHFGVKKVSVVVQEDGHVYMARGKGCHPHLAAEDPLQPAWLQMLRAASGPSHAGMMAGSEADALRRAMDLEEAEVIVPCVRGKEVIGAIFVGPRAGGERFNGDDLEFFSALSAMACVAFDNARFIEQLKKKDKELEQAYVELKALDRQKDDFIKIASHELNTPLTVVRLTTSVLLDDSAGMLSDFQRKLLHQIDQSSERLQEINEDLIHLARSNYAVLQIHRETTSLKKIIDELEKRLKPLLAKRPDLRLKIVLQPRLPEIYADVKKYVKVFEYLVQNSIKYTPEDRNGLITISARLADASSMIVCRVEDQGIGIDPKYHKKVFAPFFELADTDKHSTDKTRFQGAGLGLGLAIAKDIVETDHGTIWIESEGKDKGTSVVFTILTKQAYLKNFEREVEATESAESPEP